MLKQLLAFSCLVLICLSSCQKDIGKQMPVINSSATTDDELAATAEKVVDTTNKWYVAYAGYSGPYPIITDESAFIKHGFAHAPAINQDFDYSNIAYDIPLQYNIAGDSVTFEAKVKNISANGGQFNYDVVLQLIGENGTAHVQFVANNLSQQYTKFAVGNAVRTNLPQLLHYFDHFETVRLVMKNNGAAVYLDTTELYRFRYGAENSIGRLKTINFASKGRGMLTGVSLRNSFGRKLILTGDFNTDGQSHVIYYYQ